MSKKPEYKIIWVTPPDPVKLGKIMGEIYARGRGLEFVGLVPNEKKCGGAKLARLHGRWRLSARRG